MTQVHIPTFESSFVQVSIEKTAPTQSRKSARGKAAAVRDLIDRGVEASTAEQMVSAQEKLFPAGEIAAIMRPATSFDSWLRARVMRYRVGSGNLIAAITMLDKIERRFAEAQLAWYPLVAAWCEKYRDWLDAHAAKLGNAFDASLYPHPDTIRDRFRFNLTVQPIADPRAFDFGALSQQQADALRDRLQAAQDDAAAAATRDYADTLRDLFADFSRQIQGGKVDGSFTRFSTSKLQQAIDLIDANLNAVGSPELATALSNASDAIQQLTEAKDAGNDDTRRVDASQRAAQVAAELASVF